jgi:hypothetical protein
MVKCSDCAVILQPFSFCIRILKNLALPGLRRIPPNLPLGGRIRSIAPAGWIKNQRIFGGSCLTPTLASLRGSGLKRILALQNALLLRACSPRRAWIFERHSETLQSTGEPISMGSSELPISNPQTISCDPNPKTDLSQNSSVS